MFAAVFCWMIFTDFSVAYVPSLAVFQDITSMLDSFANTT